MAKIGLQRMASQIRLVVSDGLQNKLADPRLALIASITRVEVAANLAFADVYISVMGSENQQRTYIKAIGHAHGVLQSMVAKKIRIRTCPVLRFHLDNSIKVGLETSELIDRTIVESDKSNTEE